MTLAHDYARALYEVRKGKKVKDADLIASVIAALTRRRHEKLLPKVLIEYKKLEAENKGSVMLRVAKESEKHKGLAKLKELGIEEEPRIVVDPALVKGFVAEGKDFRYDASAKRALIDLYKRLTA